MTTSQTVEAQAILQQASEGHLDAYALIYRPNKFDRPTLEVLTGTEQILDSLAELEKIQAAQDKSGDWGTLLVTPYRQIEERGFTVINDNVPMLMLSVDQYKTLSLEDAVAALPNIPVNFRNSHFEPNDEIYESIVKKVITEEIGTGEGPNFVIKRTLCGDIADYNDGVGLTIFRNLLKQEKDAYWTFFIRMGEITMVGASPEMHIKLDGKSVFMTPISGTYRFPPSGPTQEGLEAFLCDTKEEDELFMVLDEELKMMTHICSSDVMARGPYLIQMSQLAHVGYQLEGSTNLSIHEVLMRSMFAPTVVGSPLENATRVIARHETRGRSYYSGFAALIENSRSGPMLDSAILIRTAEISAGGKMEAGVGATLVRDSDPMSEVRETAAKATAIQRAMDVSSLGNLARQASVIQPLDKRNERLSAFWLGQVSPAHQPYTEGPTIVILDNEDNFTSMMEYQLRELGLKVQVRLYSSIEQIDHHVELLIVGPGPGDPRKLEDSRVKTSRRIIMNAMELNQPFIAICFGHQVLCSLLGLSLARLSPPNQGLQKQIPIFGKMETVGFYNTFVAISETDHIDSSSDRVQVYRDPVTKEVHGLKGPNFCSMQFHPESILTKDGARILRDAVFSVSAKCILN
ncbi:anthranilate synthase family protein [Acidithiobacillus ferrivorans]|uniref:anthranilate synthase family protein n=1 Tax=Acidithiobacillus ferrivorans TaxID=160808 RepID=UPI001C075333|nr:anthranilate synthase family protein [Acidithiobacillus ferrivorans]MBU2849945.1 phenazine antibiotic biosynthesis protein [Acidithiobacillus ferrivorans]